MSLKNMNDDILILGAGPAGMAAALEFLDAEYNFSIVEKEKSVGGLAKTIRYKDFLLDIGPHILCSKPYVYDFNENMYGVIKKVLGDDLIQYESIPKKYIENVQIQKKKFAYPIQVKSALANVGIAHALEMLSDYCKAKYHSKSDHNGNGSFEHAMTSHLGRSLADLFILKYSEKIWGIKCSALSSDLAWRVGDFSLVLVLKEQVSNLWKNISSNSGHPVCYPKNGIGLICEQIKGNIETSNVGEIQVNSYPTRIVHSGNKINEVVICHNGECKSCFPKYMVSSIPINQIVQLLDPAPPLEVVDAVEKLKYRSHICLYLIINRSHVLQEHCIYFPEGDIPFARIMEQKNYCNEMSPEDMTSLSVEFFCWEGDDVWDSEDSHILNLAVTELENMGFISKKEIIDYFVHKEKYAYPVYDIEYARHLKVVRDYLEGFENIKIIGRSGSFTYMGQYRAMEMGSNAAIEIINENRELLGENS